MGYQVCYEWTLNSQKSAVKLRVYSGTEDMQPCSYLEL